MTEVAAPRWNRQWTAIEVGRNQYAISAGLDRTIDLRGLDEDLGATLMKWSAGHPVEPTTADARVLAARLADMGAIHRSELMSIVLLGDDDLCRTLEPVIGSAGYTVLSSNGDSTEVPDLAVILRAADGWPDTALPHLAVDPRFHHTLVIGPYVLPGLTTCTDCVDRRIARRWPTLDQPEHPAGVSRPALIAELLLIQLNLIRAGTSTLVNGIISWDFEAGECAHRTALMFPGCDTCDPGPTTGTIALP